MRKLNQPGFTIIELTIATLVFSTILIVIVTGVLQFTKSYTKGLISSSTQNTARGVMDTLSQGIQFTGDDLLATPTMGGVGAICMSGQQYSYKLGKQLESNVVTADQDTTAFYQTPAVSGSCAPVFTGGTELLGKHMRLAAFTITNQPGGSSIYR